MKTFTADQFKAKRAAIFREADKNGIVKINHNNYPDKVFFLESRERHASKGGDTVYRANPPMDVFEFLASGPEGEGK